MSLTPRKPVEVSAGQPAPLAKVPLSFVLRQRRVVVVGRTRQTRDHLRTLLAAGAVVDVFEEAGWIDETLEALPDRLTASQLRRLAMREGQSDKNDLGDCFLVVGHFLSDADAKLFSEHARAQNVLVCNIGRPELSDFSLPQVVNRNSVIVSVGAVDEGLHDFEKSLRNRLDKIIPSTLDAWGYAAILVAKTVRAYKAQLPGVASFWDHLSDRAMRYVQPDSVLANAKALLLDTIERSVPQDRSARGHVTLVGAGPGDAELLTLKAVRALQSADVILFDDLVSQDVLDLARREAKRMMVGKRARRASCRQDDINALMIKLAGQGKHVVRLKSGDPMMFGRAGEEIKQLSDEGISVDFVPGLTAGIAMASALGVSLTHRDISHSVRFVTGHARNGELPNDLDWQGLADRETTTVFYMGGRTSRDIAQRLIERGLPCTTPVMAVAAISRPEEAKWGGTLEQLGEGAMLSCEAVSDPKHPVLIGIGDVFADAVQECGADTIVDVKNAAQILPAKAPVGADDIG